MAEVNKVIVNGETRLDLTGDTVTEDTLLAGTTAHNASGRAITGTVVTAPIDATLTQPGQAADAAKVGRELSQLKETLATKFGWQDLQGLTDEQKVALQTAIGIRPVGEVLF